MGARRSSFFLALPLLALLAGQAAAVPCPNIMFVLDKTGSMAMDPNGGFGNPSKWQLLQAAVVKTVTMFGDQVPFGLELFSSNAFDDQQCYADTMISIEPAHDTAAKIIKIVQAATPDGGTNTGEAIKRAAVDPALADASRANYIILITDGDPNCNSGEPQFSVDQISAAAARNPSVHTFVVGFDGSGGVMPGNLNDMANAGQEPIMGCTGGKNSPCYYSASNAQKFNDAISSIINHVVGGEFGNTLCDDSCYANGCQTGYICVTDELNPKPHCAPDPCAGASCDPSQFCRLGACVDACTSPCRTTEKCVDGQCVPDLCQTANCQSPLVCNPATGQCVDNPCVDKSCKAPTTCDVGTGNCVDDQCKVITCPQGTTCVAGGNCEASGTPDGGTHTGRRAGGCAVGRAGDVTGLVFATLLLLGFFVAARRRPGR